jgi:hypothetical protein
VIKSLISTSRRTPPFIIMHVHWEVGLDLCRVDRGEMQLLIICIKYVGYHYSYGLPNPNMRRNIPLLYTTCFLPVQLPEAVQKCRARINNARTHLTPRNQDNIIQKGSLSNRPKTSTRKKVRETITGSPVCGLNSINDVSMP